MTKGDLSESLARRADQSQARGPVAISLAEDFNLGQKIAAKSLEVNLEVNRAEKVIVMTKGDLSESPARRADQRATLENFTQGQKRDAKSLEVNLEANQAERAAMGEPLESLARGPEKPD